MLVGSSDFNPVNKNRNEILIKYVIIGMESHDPDELHYIWEFLRFDNLIIQG